MSDAINLAHFDSWLDEAGPAALVIVECLQPVAEEDGVIFPPTYAPEKESGKKSEYVIDTLKDGRNVCQIDSVGAQANRLEPIFKHAPYDNLVPQVTIEVTGGHKVNLLDAGHRAADAIIRFSDLDSKMAEGFADWLKGDASKLAQVAPTSLVFGAWDSRGTQAKTPRIISSIIRAYNVELLHRSAQYIPPLEYTDKVLGEASILTADQRSEFGLTHVPAPKALGGIIVNGEIRREVTLNLVALRAICATDESNTKQDATKTLALRRYILGLALAAVAKRMVHNLRQGCLLVGVEDKPATWKLFEVNGKRCDCPLKDTDALNFANLAANDFRCTFELKSTADGGFAPLEGRFDPKKAKDAAEEKVAKKEATKAKKGRGKVAVAEEAPTPES